MENVHTGEPLAYESEIKKNARAMDLDTLTEEISRLRSLMEEDDDGLDNLVLSMYTEVRQEKSEVKRLHSLFDQLTPQNTHFLFEFFKDVSHIDAEERDWELRHLASALESTQHSVASEVDDIRLQKLHHYETEQLARKLGTVSPKTQENLLSEITAMMQGEPEDVQWDLERLSEMLYEKSLELEHS